MTDILDTVKAHLKQGWGATLGETEAIVAEVERVRDAHDTLLVHANELERENAALRQRHELAVLMAWHEGAKWGEAHPLSLCTDRNAAWQVSEAKARLT